MTTQADEFENLPEHEPAWKVGERATKYRKRLLAAGYRPLPVNGKGPPIEGWSDIQATDKIIASWEAKYASATNSGILTCDTPGVDIDITVPDAAAAVEALAREHFEERGQILVRFGKAPKRVILLRTDEPFKKIERAFTAPDGSTQQVEILAHGQQVVVAGIHPDTGKPYSWHGGEPGNIKREDLPYVREADVVAFLDATAELLVKDFDFKTKAGDSKRKANGGEQTRTDGGTAGIRERAYAEAALEGCAAELAAATPGGRNELLNKLAFRLGRMVARRWIDRASVEAELTEAMRRNGYIDDDGIGAVEATLQSGLDAGEEDPHPDLKDSNTDNGDAGDDDQQHTDSAKETEFEEAATLAIWNAGDDVDKPPPRGWLLGNVFARSFLSALLADGGTGKTALRYAQYLSLAIGRSLTGEHVFQRCRVLIVSLEDDAREIRRRILAARLHHRIDLSELDGWLFLSAPGAAAGKLMTADKKGRLRRGALAALLETAIDANKIDLLALDPFIKTHSMEENSNSAIDDVVQVLTDLAAKYDIAVDAPHHTSKGTADPGNANRGRGAGAMKDGGRLIYTLTTMTVEEAAAFNVPEDQRRSLVRMDSAKVNITPPAAHAKWFRLIGVRLGNSTVLYPNGDDVQTVEQWLPPDIWTDMTVTLQERILAAIDAGLPDGNRYTDATKADKRAAWRVVIEHMPTKSEPQARSIIKQWLKDGQLERRTYQNPVTWKDVSGLYRP
jgi:hypothetical protein